MEISTGTVIILSLIVLTIAIGSLVFNQFPTSKDLPYQGPVPEGYDEEHFRETGETIKKEGVVIS